MNGRRVQTARSGLTPIIYPMHFGLASDLSCARAVISCPSESSWCCSGGMRAHPTKNAAKQFYKLCIVSLV